MEDVLGFVEKAGRALHASRQLAESIASEQEKVASLLPVDADAMAGIKLLDGSSLIDSNEKQAAVTKLSSHQGALEVLHNVLEIFSEQQKVANQTIKMLQQGKGEKEGQQKQASSNSSASPFVGARHGDGDQPESWTKFASALGVG
jgi:hypothetical protein